MLEIHSIGHRFYRTLKPSVWIKHSAVLPTVAIMFVGMTWAFVFGTYSLIKKPDVDFFKVPRIFSIDHERCPRMIDQRPLRQRPLFPAKEKEEFVALKKELYEIYYPRK